MPFCHCDTCTHDGETPEGAWQSRATCSKHAQSQRAQERLRTTAVHSGGHEPPARDFERDTILDTLEAPDVFPENPLWRGVQGVHTILPKSHLSSSTRPSEPTDTPDLNSGQGVEYTTLEILNCQIDSHLSSFSRPLTLRFVFPPTSPTAMYPGPHEEHLWDEGPSAVVVDTDSAATMLHVKYLRSAQHSLPRTCGGGQALVIWKKVSRKLAEELEGLELFRSHEWRRQQKLVEDPYHLRTSSAHVARTYQSGKSCDHLSLASTYEQLHRQVFCSAPGYKKAARQCCRLPGGYSQSRLPTHCPWMSICSPCPENRHLRGPRGDRANIL